MNKVCGILVCLLLVGCALRGGDKTNSMRRVRFVPGSPPTSPLEASGSAVWTALRPFPEPDSDSLVLNAWAGVGDKFPVGTKGGATLFEVLLKDGDDERVSLEILSDHGSQTIEVQRDKPAQVEVAGVKYEFTYPTVGVGSTEEKTTTNKAMLIVSTRRR